MPRHEPKLLRLACGRCPIVAPYTVLGRDYLANPESNETDTEAPPKTPLDTVEQKGPVQNKKPRHTQKEEK